MFEKRKALLLYKKMLVDIYEMRRLHQENENYPGFEKGYVIIPKPKKENEKILNHIASFAAKDKFTFYAGDVQNIYDGSIATFITIDNGLDKVMDKHEENDKVIHIDDYRRKRAKN